ncbi:hypothetical protein NCPPB940_18230 [Xanthomonas hortorum pv. taraxaci]|nr:hypothetical protein NCPPB940_18230 [Xanthomonas hortorum pv. taraxaci]CAD0324529.1 hypothetical protein NCPPB940_18230 [Xanthomonas hortorum pv. taraxaci]
MHLSMPALWGVSQDVLRDRAMLQPLLNVNGIKQLRAVMLSGATALRMAAFHKAWFCIAWLRMTSHRNRRWR